MDKNHVNFISTQSNLSWDEYFMLQAIMASFKSKDPATKVGCVFVDQNNHQLSMGYNGMTAGIDESQVPWGKDKSVPLDEQKYAYVVHSEANAILHAKTSLKGSRVYVTLFPCHECAKMLATTGVTEVIYLSNKYNGRVENRVAKKIFEMSNISYRQQKISPELISKLAEYITDISKPD